MSAGLKPWTRGAFELIVHAEMHLREGGDFDRRIAHIGFDNAVEVAITTYLGLKPIQRGGRKYNRDDVEKWTANYHTKMEFLEVEAKARGWNLRIPTDEVIYYHDIRNNQYHAGGPGVPETVDLHALRQAALDVFAMLFDVANPDQELEKCLQQRFPKEEDQPRRNPTVDKLLEDTEEQVVIAGQPYTASEALFATDPKAYQAVAAAVTESRNILEELTKKYPGALRPDLVHIGFVHYDEGVYIKLVRTDGKMDLTDTEFVAGRARDGQFFSPSHSPEENANLMVNEFDPYSIINCFEIFTEDAAREVAKAYEAERQVTHCETSRDVGEANNA